MCLTAHLKLRAIRPLLFVW